MEKAKASKAGIIESFVFPKGSVEDNFGLVYNGFIKIPETGVYTFYLNSDDGSELFIGGKSIILNDGKHGPQIFKAKMALQQGFHPVKVLYFEGDGGQLLDVSYEGPGIPKQPVPGSAVYFKEQTK